MKEICVVHLVRAKNGIEPFERFLKSYRENPGGIEHDFLVLFKGFEREDQLQEYRLVLEPFKHMELHVLDEGFDITAYLAVPRSFDYKYYCFLNSFSIILDAVWLLKMYQYISRDKVGLVGATGSYESLYIKGNNQRLFIGASLKSKYPRIGKYWIGRVGWTLRCLVEEWKLRSYFDQFPNYHIRSNAFMVKTDVLKKVVCPQIRTKMDAYKCESGKRSITRQIMEFGKSALVIGKDGKAYEKEDWWQSKTFRQADQSNLLIADNQTRAYAEGGLRHKTLSSRSAWGENARPDMTEPKVE